jgi:hypothetical protein
MKRMGADLSDLTKINKQAAETVLDTARSLTPTRTGRLRKSLRAGATRTRGTVSAGGGLVEYAGPIHFGWPARNIEPNPFIYDALDARKGEVVDKYEAHIEALVRKLDRETPG